MDCYPSIKSSCLCIPGANAFCNCKMLQPTLCHGPTKGSNTKRGADSKSVGGQYAVSSSFPSRTSTPKKWLRYVAVDDVASQILGTKIKKHINDVSSFLVQTSSKLPCYRPQEKRTCPGNRVGVGDKGTSPCSARTSAKSQGGKREIQSKPPGLVTKHCYPYHAVCPFRYYLHGSETVFLRYLFSSFQVDKLERTWILRYWCLLRFLKFMLWKLNSSKQWFLISYLANQQPQCHPRSHPLSHLPKLCLDLLAQKTLQLTRNSDLALSEPLLTGSWV